MYMLGIIRESRESAERKRGEKEKRERKREREREREKGERGRREKILPEIWFDCTKGHFIDRLRAEANFSALYREKKTVY